MFVAAVMWYTCPFLLHVVFRHVFGIKPTMKGSLMWHVFLGETTVSLLCVFVQSIIKEWRSKKRNVMSLLFHRMSLLVSWLSRGMSVVSSHLSWLSEVDESRDSVRVALGFSNSSPSSMTLSFFSILHDSRFAASFPRVCSLVVRIDFCTNSQPLISLLEKSSSLYDSSISLMCKKRTWNVSLCCLTLRNFELFVVMQEPVLLSHNLNDLAMTKGVRGISKSKDIEGCLTE